MKVIRFCFLALLASAALGLFDRHPLGATGLIFLAGVLSVVWNRRGKLPDVEDNSDEFK